MTITSRRTCLKAAKQIIREHKPDWRRLNAYRKFCKPIEYETNQNTAKKG